MRLHPLGTLSLSISLSLFRVEQVALHLHAVVGLRHLDCEARFMRRLGLILRSCELDERTSLLAGGRLMSKGQRENAAVAVLISDEKEEEEEEDGRDEVCAWD